MRPGKILITGKNGLLGTELIRFFSASHETTGVGREDADITDYDSLKALFTSIKPEIVIHSAGMTGVDKCETEKDLAHTTNVSGTEYLVSLSKKHNCYLIYYSTDYVFDGQKKTAYIEQDQPSPINVYGETKFAGERAVWEGLSDYAIVRVSWLYGINKMNFIRKMINTGLRQIRVPVESSDYKTITVVSNQISAPTSVEDVAKQTGIIVDNRLTGILHCTGEEGISRFDLVRKVYEMLNIDVEVKSCLLEETGDIAQRPGFSVLRNERLRGMGLNSMNNYRTGLKMFFDKYKDRLLDGK